MSASSEAARLVQATLGFRLLESGAWESYRPRLKC